MKAAKQEFPPECPKEGTGENVSDPHAWANRCFKAVNGRDPNPDVIGESTTLYRDIDLDGENERLEVTGVGNSFKQIYVFKISGKQNHYMGELNANLSLKAVEENGKPVIEFIYRMGVDHLELVRMQYVDNAFIRVSSRPFTQ